MDEIALKSLEDFAFLQFSLQELSLLTGFDICELYKTDHKIKKAVDRGRLLCEAKIRTGLIEHAASGSATAQEQVLKLIKSYKIKEA